MKRIHNHHRTINKRMLVIMAALTLMTFSNQFEHADAQIFIVDDDEYLTSNRTSIPPGGFVPITPQGGTDDSIYTPLGSGWMLLTGLGTAYLLGKRRKKKD